MQVREWHREDHTISTEKARLDLDVIHGFLTHAYWCRGIPRALVARAIEHSLCFGLYSRDTVNGSSQVGFARVVSDYATFAYVCDVFVLDEHRGKGHSKWLMECVLEHPELQGLRRYCLGTRDAQGLYERFGFAPVKQPANWLEIKREGLYERRDASMAFGEPTGSPARE